jgi:hypothetical protein
MTVVKLNSKLAANASAALEPHVPLLYAKLGKRVLGIVEVASVERTEGAPDEDKEPSVGLQIKHMEIAGPAHEDAIRQALRALYTQRTAFGKLTEEGDVELSERTLAECGGQINAIEAARLHIGIEQWGGYGRQVLRNETLTASDLRQELTTITDALRALVRPEAITVES